MQCLPVNLVKMPENMFVTWLSSWRKSVLIITFEIMIRVIDGRENYAFITRSGET